MRLKYIGRRDLFPMAIGAKKYVFKPDNGYVIDVPDKDAQWMMQIASHEFKVLPSEAPVEKQTLPEASLEELDKPADSKASLEVPRKKKGVKKNAAV